MGSSEKEGMIGIVAVSHCCLAQEMLRVAEMIIGPIENCKAVSLDQDLPVDAMMRQLQDTIREVDAGRGVLILTDLFGGTPANISLAFLGPGVEVVCGMNLPMLIKLAGCRAGMDLAQVAAIVKEYGRRHISLASEVLSRSVEA
ncbi:MAG: PTS sugar transporter subunit IIA [Deltaproteobacteria bacterium]|nr:PTS sugar transporter subunit IIA [Deltaproteobacteria bacterium]